MGGDHDDAGRSGELLDALIRLLDETCIASAETLVEQEDLGLDRRRYGEVEPRPHAGRIGAERHLDERTELGEGDDLLHPLVDLAFAEAEIEPTQLDILAAGELRVDAEAAAE